MAKKKKAPEAEKENSERWLVSYSDFVTLLLGVFIIMYSMAAAETAQATGGTSGRTQANFLAALVAAFGGSDSLLMENSGDSIIDMYEWSDLTPEMAEQQTMERIKEEIEEYVENLTSIESDSIEVTIDEYGVNIRIKDKVLFNSGKHQLNAAAVPIIAQIGDILRQLPNNYIQIEGHTDTVPMSGNNDYVPTNWELGSLRATNVLRMLVEKSALNPRYLTAVSFGEFRPLTTNLTEAGRATNRRVEIRILRNYMLQE